MHLPRVLLITLAGYNYFTAANFWTYIGSMMGFQSVAYPFLTIQRRLECQSSDKPGMIPSRYEGAVHAAGLIWREEGIRGLYRGYIPYMIATGIYWILVPLVAEIKLQG